MKQAMMANAANEWQNFDLSRRMKNNTSQTKN